MKTIEIKDLKEKISFYQCQQNMGSGQNSELEQVKRDKSIACGLVNTMQRDLSNKDSTISKLAREIEGYKRELKDREARYTELEEKYNIAIDPKRIDEEKQNKEKELIVLRSVCFLLSLLLNLNVNYELINFHYQKFKQTEEKIIDLNNQILHIKNDLEDSSKQSAKFALTEKQLKEEIEHTKNQYLDVQRAERTVRIDLEQMRRTVSALIQKKILNLKYFLIDMFDFKYDKFRNLIIQSVYSQPDGPRPSGETTDEDLVEAWRKIIDEKNKLAETLSNVQESLKKSEEISKETVKNVNNFKNTLIAIEVIYFLITLFQLNAHLLLSFYQSK